MAIPHGTRLGPYEVVSAIGAGGMGEVYKAQDTRLNRTVAIKVLPANLAEKPGLRERFEREARTIAGLNHPHICILYDVGHQDGTDYLVMEYLEGETMAQRLLKGPLPLDQVLRYAIEIADALDKAHRKGVTHRDLKPGNILLTKSGAKLLDFGLAKLRQEAAPAASLSALPTVTKDAVTAEGTILGTLQYMAPEQVEGKTDEIDARTDIFAFGAVVYEMATGKKAFEGKTQASLIAKILETDPAPMSSLQPMTPAALDHAVKKCLAKDPDDRWQTVRDVWHELRWIGEDAGRQPPGRAGGVRHTALWLGAVVLAASMAVWGWLRPTVGTRGDPARFVIPLPADEQPYMENWSPPVAVSRDGTRLAYTAARGETSRLYVQVLDELEPRAMPRTDGAHTPFFSPDGRWAGFIAADKLWKISLDGGAPLPICDVADVRFGATWGADEMIYFADDSGLWRVSATGETPELVSPVDPDSGEIWRGAPQVLPDGRVLFSVDAATGEHAEVLDPDSGESRIVLESGLWARYLPSGYLVYSESGVMQVVAFNLGRLTATSPPIAIPEDVSFSPLGNALFTVSESGMLVYLPGSTAVRGSFMRARGGGELQWVTRDGREMTLREDWPAERPRLSPDGRRAVDYILADPTDAGSNYHVWVFDLERHTRTKLTSEGTSVIPVWAPDGRRVAFSSTRQGPMSLYMAPADGDTEPEPLLIRPSDQYASSWSPDGRYLAYHHRDATTRFDIWLLPLDGDRNPQPFLQTPANERALAFSPDGQWVAYVSDASGRYEVYVQPFPGPGERTIVSNTGGRVPRWAPDGHELFYRQGDGMWAVPLQTQPVLEVGTPELLFEGPYASDYDVDPRGRGFLMLRIDPPAEPSRFHVVLNWFEELKQRVPTN